MIIPKEIMTIPRKDTQMNSLYLQVAHHKCPPK